MEAGKLRSICHIILPQDDENFVALNFKITVFITKFISIIIFGCKSVGDELKIETHFVKIFLSDR